MFVHDILAGTVGIAVDHDKYVGLALENTKAHALPLDANV